jgi:lysozyme family protein
VVDTLIDEIIARESSKDTNDPNDAGGRTKYGISIHANPEAWVNGPPTRDAAAKIYLDRYIVQPGFLQVTPEYLMDQLVDYGVTSGPLTAIMHLQRVLGLKQDGQLGPVTLAALKTQDPITLNNKLVDDRVLMMARIVQKHPSDIEFLFGWLTRALGFRRG